MIVETDKELEGLKEIGQICGRVLKETINYAKVGMTTKELDNFAVTRKIRRKKCTDY